MAKLKCTNILPLIPLLVDGALSATESDSIEKHLSVCPDCRREFDLYRAMKQTAASLSSPSLSSDFHENLMKTIGEVTRSQETTAPKRARVLRPSFLRHAMGFAAAAAVVALSVVTLSQVSFLGIPKASPSDNLDDFVTQPQVTQSQEVEPQVTQPRVAEGVTAQSRETEPQVTQSQGAQPKVADSSVATPNADDPTRSIDSQVTQPQVTQPQVAPSQVTPSQTTPHQDAPAQESTAPAASCEIVAEEPQQKFATYRVFIEKAYLTEAEALLANCTQDAHGYRIDNGAAPLLDALSALPGYRTECIENNAAQTDYILLIGE